MDNANQAAFNWIHELAGRSLWGDQLGVLLAAYLPYFLVAGILFFLLERPDWRARTLLFFQLGLAALLSRGLLTVSIQFFYRHPRPFEALGFLSLIPEAGNSFPSGHAALLFSLAATIFIFDRKWGWWYLVLSLLNGLARIFVGVHWPLDILGGFLTGVISAAIIYFLFWPQWRAIRRKMEIVESKPDPI